MPAFTEEVLAALPLNDSYTFSTYKTLYNELQHGFKLRPLSADDYLKGYLDLISDEDAKTAVVDCEKFQQYFSFINSIPDMYYPIVVEDTNTLQIVGTGMLVVEQKFIHQTALRGRMENVYVSEEYRRRGIGTLILETLTLFAEQIGCYKVNLSCPRDMVQFCEKLKLVYETGQNIMLLRFSKNQNSNALNKSML